MQQAATASPAAAKRVLIGGGSGFIGQALSKHLLNKGCEVTLISRNPARVGGAGLPAISWANLADPSFTLASYDAVVNLAGVSLNRPAWIETYKDQIVSSRVDTTRAIVKAIENTAQSKNKPPKVFVVGSAVGYYPSGIPGPEVDEYYSKPPPSTFFGDLVRQLEDEAKTLVQTQQNTRLAFVRTGVVLGKNGGAFPSLKRSTGFYIGSGEQWFPWIHINDIVGIFSHAIHNEQCSGPLNGAAPGIVTAKEFAETMAEQRVGIRKALPLPSFVMKVALGPLRSTLVTEGQKVIPKKTLETGYQFQFPELGPALQDLLR